MTGHGGKSGAEFDADEAVVRDAQPTTTSCFFCAWRFIGLAGEGRERAAAHRRDKHPELVPKKKRYRSRFSIRR